MEDDSDADSGADGLDCGSVDGSFRIRPLEIIPDVEKSLNFFEHRQNLCVRQLQIWAAADDDGFHVGAAVSDASRHRYRSDSPDPAGGSHHGQKGIRSSVLPYPYHCSSTSQSVVVDQNRLQILEAGEIDVAFYLGDVIGWCSPAAGNVEHKHIISNNFSMQKRVTA